MSKPAVKHSLIAFVLYSIALAARLIGISEPALQGDELLWLKRSEALIERARDGEYSALTTHLLHPGIPEAVAMAAGIVVMEKFSPSPDIPKKNVRYVPRYRGARIANAAISALVVPALYLLALQFTGISVAVLAALMLAVESQHVGNSRLIHIDTMMSLFVTLTIFFYALAVERKQLKYKLLAGLTFGLCISTKVTAGSLVPLFICYKFVRNFLVPKATDTGERGLVVWSDVWAIFIAHLFLGAVYTRLWLHLDRHLGRFLVKSRTADYFYSCGHYLRAHTGLTILAAAVALFVLIPIAIWARRGLRNSSGGKRDWRTLCGWHLSMVMLIGIALHLYAAIAPQVVENIVRFWTFASTLRNEAPEDPGIWHTPAYGYLEFLFRKLHPIALLGAAVSLALMVYRTRKQFRTALDRKPLILQILLLLLVVIWITPISLASKQDYRYVIPILPGLYLFAAIGLVWLFECLSAPKVRLILSGAAVASLLVVLVDLFPNYLIYFNSVSGGFESAKAAYLRFPYLGYREALAFADADARSAKRRARVFVYGDIRRPTEIYYSKMIEGKIHKLDLRETPGEHLIDYVFVFGAHSENLQFVEKKFQPWGGLTPVYSYLHKGVETLRVYKIGFPKFEQQQSFNVHHVASNVGYAGPLEKYLPASGEHPERPGIIAVPGRHPSGDLLSNMHVRFAPGDYQVRFLLGLPGNVPVGDFEPAKGVIKIKSLNTERLVRLEELSQSELRWFEMPLKIEQADTPLIRAHWFGKIPIIIADLQVVKQGSSPPLPEQLRARLSPAAGSGPVAGTMSGEAEVVVYGATPGGIVAAIAAKRSGRSVILVESSNQIGGMISGGLGYSDVCRKKAIGATAREFFIRVGKVYGSKFIRYNFEPKVGLKVLNDMLEHAKVPVVTGERLTAVKKDGARVTELQMESGRTFKGRVFVDGTYEGDLLARGGVSYTYGRESSADYGETFAGVRPYSEARQFTVPVAAHDKNNRLLPGIQETKLAPLGTGDKKVMAYNFRLCMTNEEKNEIPVNKPQGYDPHQYELLARFVQSVPVLTVHDLLMFHPVAGQKVCINRNGPFSTNYIGENWGWPEGSYAEREEIFQRHKHYTQGLLYFLWNDPRVPEDFRRKVAPWGYCKDEFTASGNWPHQLYVREARRMIGEYVLSEKDLLKEVTKPDVIGLATCPIEIHETQRVVKEDGTVANEGFTFHKVEPYAIPYRSVVPKAGEADNLLVPVAISATHVAYSSLRMEPVYMILGHSVGVAASIAVEKDCAVQNVDIAELQKRLRDHTQVL